jgi:hypothetical protein
VARVAVDGRTGGTAPLIPAVDRRLGAGTAGYCRFCTQLAIMTGSLCRTATATAPRRPSCADGGQPRPARRARPAGRAGHDRPGPAVRRTRAHPAPPDPRGRVGPGGAAGAAGRWAPVERPRPGSRRLALGRRAGGGVRAGRRVVARHAAGGATRRRGHGATPVGWPGAGREFGSAVATWPESTRPGSAGSGSRQATRSASRNSARGSSGRVGTWSRMAGDRRLGASAAGSRELSNRGPVWSAGDRCLRALTHRVGVWVRVHGDRCSPRRARWLGG